MFAQLAIGLAGQYPHLPIDISLMLCCLTAAAGFLRFAHFLLHRKYPQFCWIDLMSGRHDAAVTALPAGWQDESLYYGVNLNHHADRIIPHFLSRGYHEL